MALRQAGLVFRAEAAALLVITPRSGEGFRIRRLLVSNVSGTPANVLVVNDTARVGFFRVAGRGGSHLLSARAQEVANNVRGTNLLDWMLKYSGFLGYPVVQGEALTLSVDTGTADFFAVGDSYDAGDIDPTAQNGSHSKDILFVNYGSNASTISATGYNKLDKTFNPAEMVAFPFGLPGAGLVPAGKRVDLQVIGGQAAGRFASAGNTGQNQYIRPRLGTAPAATILDRNDVGIPFFGTVPGAAGVDYTSVRQGIPSNPRSFETLDDVIPDLIFSGNDEFSLQVQSTIVGTGTIAINDIDVWVLMRVFPA